MALTGDLELLHIADIIQVIHTTRKSGTFTVKSSRGESRIIFSNGYIVGASHLNNSVRLGTVLVKMSAITVDDLRQALDAQRQAGMDRKPLVATLIQMGKIKHEDAFKGLKKLIEITIVELIGWTEGTFTLDTEAIAVSDDCRYLPGEMEQAMNLDSQMVLMDALRIFDERERDRQAGKDVPLYEEFYADVLSEGGVRERQGGPCLTADDLGLADVESLENRIPEAAPVLEVFDPVEMHRQKVKETLADFTEAEQETFVSFLKKSGERTGGGETPLLKGAGPSAAFVLFSSDKLIRHSVMTVCKQGVVMVFATDERGELDHIMAQCLSRNMTPAVVLDVPGGPDAETGHSEEDVAGLRQWLNDRYPAAPVLYLACMHDYPFMLRSYRDGALAVIPRPCRETGRETFIQDTMAFLESFNAYITLFPAGRGTPAARDDSVRKIRDRMAVMKELTDPLDVSSELLHTVADMVERAIAFFVRPADLTGESAIGVVAEKAAGPTPAASLKVPLKRSSLLRDVIESGRVFFGETDDESLGEYLLKKIGRPVKPTVVLVPVTNMGKVVIVIYGDFGRGEVSPVNVELLEIAANQAGIIIENVRFRKQLRDLKK